jgi:hypothetical protein
MEREQRIRERAFIIWEAEGCPSGREGDHWERAEREIDQEVTLEFSGKGPGENDHEPRTSFGATAPMIDNPAPVHLPSAKEASSPPARRSNKRKVGRGEV